MAAALNLGTQTLSVNLLPMTLVNVPGAVSFLLDAIKTNGLVPEQVIVEFTENEIISRTDEFTNAVRLLKAAGFRVAIDHFGAGFAGLLLLAQFQPERIKINRDLIKDVHKSGPRQAIIQAIIKCCVSLEIMVSAVGVEKAEEWMWLESAGISQFGVIFLPLLHPGLFLPLRGRKKRWPLNSICCEQLAFPCRNVFPAVWGSQPFSACAGFGEIKSIFAHGPFPVMLAHKHFLVCTSYENCTICTEE